MKKPIIITAISNTAKSIVAKFQHNPCHMTIETHNPCHMVMQGTKDQKGSNKK